MAWDVSIDKTPIGGGGGLGGGAVLDATEPYVGGADGVLTSMGTACKAAWDLDCFANAAIDLRLGGGMIGTMLVCFSESD